MDKQSWGKEHPEEHNAYNRKWKQEHPERVKAWRKKYKANHADKVLATSQRYRRKLKAEVLAHYGNCCAICGSTERLSIDHVNGDGAKHRKSIGMSDGGDKFYVWLKRQGFPKEGFRVLCVPCNAREWQRMSGRKKKYKTCPKCGHKF